MPFECQVVLFDRCLLCCLSPRPLHVHIDTDPRLRLIETYLYRAAKSTSHSLNMKNGAWEGEGRLGERSMIWICMCRLSLHPVCAFVCLHVCIGGAAALLDIWMSNDVIPDWAITTSARLLKREWSDGGRRLVALVPRKWKREQCRKFYIYSISLIEYQIHSHPNVCFGSLNIKTWTIVYILCCWLCFSQITEKDVGDDLLLFSGEQLTASYSPLIPQIDS